jgi:membrane protein DedA with SNARE-associated domain
VPWTVVLAVAGYEGGKNWNRISGPIGDAGIVLAVALVAVVVVWWVRGRGRSAATASGPAGTASADRRSDD